MEEVDKLWKKKRPEVTKALAAAAAEGDRSENAEYIYRKKNYAKSMRGYAICANDWMASLSLIASPTIRTRYFLAPG